MAGKPNIVNTAILHKTDLPIQCNHYPLPIVFFFFGEIDNPKIHMEMQGIQNSQIILEKRSFQYKRKQMEYIQIISVQGRKQKSIAQDGKSKLFQCG